MSKKALILGIGHAQVDAIRCLKEAGWRVIGCSYRHEGKGIGLVDQFEQIDIKDFAAVEGLGRNEKIDLIYSVGSDLAISTVAKVATKLGLGSFIQFETADLLLHKPKLRGFLAKNSISAIEYKEFSNIGDLVDWNHFPAIVKPPDSQGQRGIFGANSHREIKVGFESALKFSGTKTLIIEEFLDGPEISVNSFVIDSRVVFNAISDRIIVEGCPAGIPQCHFYPTRSCPGETLAETEALIERCIKALAIQNGPVYFQIKLTAKGPRIVEITPRLDGCHIWRLIKTVSGIDLLDASFKLLSGDNHINLKINSPNERHQLSFFLSPPRQMFKKVDYPVQERASYVEYFYEDCEIVHPLNGVLEKVGYYIEPE